MDATKTTSPAPGCLFVHAMVQVFQTDAALVAAIGKAARMNKAQRAELAAGLAAMRQEGREIAPLRGLSLAGAGAAGAGTVVTVFADGRAGIGPVLSDEPAALQGIKARAAEDGAELPSGFAIVVFPAGAVAGSLQ
ncbi:MAG: hypothetical protein RL456_616 [Pseudomonadota bacterium]|jgi:hypothetical protein